MRASVLVIALNVTLAAHANHVPVAEPRHHLKSRQHPKDMVEHEEDCPSRAYGERAERGRRAWCELVWERRCERRRRASADDSRRSRITFLARLRRR